MRKIEREELKKIRDELAELTVEMMAFTHEITDLFEAYNKREEENHLLLVRILERLPEKEDDKSTLSLFG